MKRALVCVIGLFIAAGCSRHQQPPPIAEPSYNGKNLSAWLADCKELDSGEVVLSEAAQEAVRSLGTNALPWLTSEINVHDAQGQFGPHPAIDRHHVAQLALALLGPQASSAAGRFQPLFDHLDNYNDGRYTAIEALQHMGPEGVPMLLFGLKHPDGQTREKCALALAEITPAPTNAVPALVALLSDPEPLVRAAAAHALGRIRAEAATVVPALTTVFTTAPAFLAQLPPKPTVVTDRTRKAKVVMVKQLPIANSMWVARFVSDIQVAAAEALGAYGPEAKDALPELNAYLQKPVPGGGPEIYDRQVRRAIKEALPQIAGR